MRIPSGTTDQVIFFVAVDVTDLKTRETGLTTFTVYRARDTGTATAMTTPTVAELSAANMPGVYSLLLDEDMTIGAGNDSEEMVFHITQASMAPVTRSIELYRPKLTVGTTLDVSAGGEAGVDWANVGSPTTTVALTGTTVAVTQKVDVDTIKTNPVVNGGTVTFPTNATLASTTNLTGGTLTTVTNVTNAPTSGDLTATMKTSVQTAVEAGLVTHRLDELLNADSDIDGLTPPAVGSVFHELLTKTAGSFTYDQTTDSLEAVRDRGDAAWITATGFALATVCTEARLAELDAANLPATTDSILTDTGTTLDGRIPAALVAGRMDASVGAVAAGAITAAGIAADAIGASELAADAANEIADAILDRDMSTGTDSGSTTVRTPRQALRALRNRVAIAAGTLTAYKEDDTTASWTGAVTTAAGNPISEVDPARP